MPSRSSERTRAFALLFVMPLFFSSNLVLGRSAIVLVEPWTLACLRWVLTFAVLAPFLARDFIHHRALLVREWKLLTVLGILGMWICGAVVYYALTITTATNATLIYTCAPVLILLLEWAFRGRSIAPREIIGIMLALAGVVVIVVKGSLSALLAMQFNAGDLLIAGCALSWALYSVLLKTSRLQELPTLTLFAAVAFAGAVSLAPFMALEASLGGHLPTSGAAWISIASIVVFPSILAFSTFQYGIKVVGPSLTGLFMYLMPPYGVVMAIVFLGEEFHGFHIAGFALVMSGLLLATVPLGARGRARGMAGPGQ